MQIILFNGPPESGKDDGALYSLAYYGGSLEKFAEPLKNGAAAICFKGDRAAFDKFDSGPIKNEPRPEFFGMSCRQFQIWLSENVLKPKFGKTVFGRILAGTIKRGAAKGIDKFFVSDSGFGPEGEELISEFGAENISLLRIHRPGKTYEGDSRSYINLDSFGVRSFDVQNDSTLEVYHDRLKEILTPIIGA